MSFANAGYPDPPVGADRPGDSRAGTVVWAYAIAASDRVVAADLTGLAGVAAAPVRVAACSGLSMLVSDLSRTEFGEAGLRGNLENLDWLDEVARAHHDVVDAAAGLFPLLPARLATVYSGDAAVRDTLAGRRTALLDALRRVGGHVEWGVKAYAQPELELETAPAERNPDEDGLNADDAGSGLAYLRRRRALLTAGQQARAAASEGARSAHAALAEQAERARLHPLQSPQLTGVQLPMLLNAAYLLEADGGPAFTAAVGAVATSHPELRIELTGPWPPYSFADDDDDSDGDGDDRR